MGRRAGLRRGEGDGEAAGEGGQGCGAERWTGGLRRGEASEAAARGGGQGGCSAGRRARLRGKAGRVAVRSGGQGGCGAGSGWDACGQSPNSATIVERTVAPPGMSRPAQFAICSQRHSNV